MAEWSRSPLLVINQWLSTWNLGTWNTKRPEPPKRFYVGSMSLKTLRGLSGVRPRTEEDRRAGTSGVGYQREHDKERLNKIGRYVEYGFPISNERGLDPAAHAELINPGWLPTAILVNVIGAHQTRPKRGTERSVDSKNAVRVIQDNGFTFLEYPENTIIDQDKELPPLEIIDGQHRLLASDTVEQLTDDYQVPIIIFDDLPLNWQAYLFWVINVEPKRINTSLAFDLYPDLRDQDWLQRGESLKIYQEHRSQELAEVLWKHPQSPWKDRVELFGKRVDGHVSNAAVIRSLMTTFVRPFGKIVGPEDELTKIGGLFGSIDRNGDTYIIRWRRPEQAAYLLLAWTAIQAAVSRYHDGWKAQLQQSLTEKGMWVEDAAFSGSFTLLATDQGFRAISFAINAMSQVQLEEIGLLDIESPEGDSEPTGKAVSDGLFRLSNNTKITNFLAKTAEAIVQGVDWRTSSAPNLPPETKAMQSQYRGSSGYGALNRAVIAAAAKSSSSIVATAASDVARLQGWNE